MVHRPKTTKSRMTDGWYNIVLKMNDNKRILKTPRKKLVEQDYDHSTNATCGRSSRVGFQLPCNELSNETIGCWGNRGSGINTNTHMWWCNQATVRTSHIICMTKRAPQHNCVSAAALHSTVHFLTYPSIFSGFWVTFRESLKGLKISLINI